MLMWPFSASGEYKDIIDRSFAGTWERKRRRDFDMLENKEDDNNLVELAFNGSGIRAKFSDMHY